MATILSPVWSGVESALKANLFPLAASTAYIGILFHAVVVRNLRVEEYLYPFLGSFVLAAGGLLSTCLSLFSIREGLTRAVLVFGSFNVGIFFSMALYRLFFHPLRQFPGPWGAKLSRFYATAASAKEVKYHKEIGKWHDKYGDFIRTGKHTFVQYSRLALNRHARAPRARNPPEVSHSDNLRAEF